MGKELRDLRTAAGLTLSALQAVSGIHRSTISQAENGLLALSLIDENRLCQLLRRIAELRTSFPFLDWRNVDAIKALLAEPQADQAAASSTPVKIRRTQAGQERLEGDAWMPIYTSEVDALRMSGAMILWNPEE